MTKMLVSRFLSREETPVKRENSFPVTLTQRPVCLELISKLGQSASRYPGRLSLTPCRSLLSILGIIDLLPSFRLVAEPPNPALAPMLPQSHHPSPT
jgi:hypothetical protein